MYDLSHPKRNRVRCSLVYVSIHSEQYRLLYEFALFIESGWSLGYITDFPLIAIQTEAPPILMAVVSVLVYASWRSVEWWEAFHFILPHSVVNA